MGEMKHTPGVWRHKDWMVGAFVDEKLTDVICWTANNAKNRTEMAKADARLIAASPDLLKCVLDAMSTDGVILTMEVGCAMEEAAFKATGKTLDELFPEAKAEQVTGLEEG